MERKYNMNICNCGRIHMIENEKLDKALKNNKNLLVICGGCGHAFLLGADIVHDWLDPDPDSTVYMMYSRTFSPYKDATVITDNFKTSEEYKGIEEIIYSHGLKVPMMTGSYARNYTNGIFYDIYCPDFYKIRKKDITVNEIMSFIDEFNERRQTVNMNIFINETPEDMLKEISSYYIEGFDWSGTKYQNEWNSK